MKQVSVYFVYALTGLYGTGIFAGQMLLSLYALKLGATPFWIGVLAATFALCPMLLAVFAGRLVDRYGCRWPMTLGTVCGALGMLVPFFFQNLPAVYVAGTLNGLANIFFSLSTQNLIGLLSTPDTRARYFANYALTSSLGMLLGPLLGGFSIDHAGHAYSCLYLSLLILVPTAMLVIKGRALPGGTRRGTKAAGGGIRAMLADPNVRRMLITGSLANVGINLYQFYMPVYGHSLALSASAIGVIMAMNSSAAFIARFSLPVLLHKLGEERVLSYAFYMGAVSLIAIPLFHHAAMLALVSFTFGLGMGCGQPIVIMMMFTNSRDGRSGETLGLKFTTNQLTKLVSPVFFGAVASVLGLLGMFWVNAAMLVVGGFISRSKKGQTQQAVTATKES